MNESCPFLFPVSLTHAHTRATGNGGGQRSHTWTSHVTGMNESYHTYECVISDFLSLSLFLTHWHTHTHTHTHTYTHIQEPWGMMGVSGSLLIVGVSRWVMSHIWMSHGAYLANSGRIWLIVGVSRWDMSHIWMSHVWQSTNSSSRSSWVAHFFMRATWLIQIRLIHMCDTTHLVTPVSLVIVGVSRWVMSHIWKSHIWMSHVARVNESFRTCE